MWLCVAFNMKLHEVMAGMEEREWIQQILALHWPVVAFAVKWKGWKFLCVVLQNWEKPIQVKSNWNQNPNPRISHKGSFSH